VFGAYQTAPVRDAALLNGISAHSLELDDTHAPSSTYPGSVIWTSLLAAAADRTATTAGVLDAVVIGYQVMTALGETLNPARLYGQGLHPTAICGVFGAAAATGRLAGLDARTIRRAFGVALSMAAGSMAYLSEGAWTKRFHPGFAAAGGILAADLAASGFTAPLDAFEDRNGLMHIYGGARSREHVQGVLSHLGDLAAVHQTGVKFHPCCRYMHGVMDLLAAYRSEGGRIDGLTSIDCGVLSAGMSLVGEPLSRKRQVTSMVDAQFSMPFGATLALSRGESSVRDFERADQLAHELEPLMNLTHVYASQRLDAAYPSQWVAEVILRFADGEAVELATASFRGSPGWPAGRAELSEKAAGLLGDPTASRLLAAVEGLADGEPFHPSRLTGLRAAPSG
jgi:2-methylcitrate dehydratase PrpD